MSAKRRIMAGSLLLALVVAGAAWAVWPRGDGGRSARATTTSAKHAASRRPPPLHVTSTAPAVVRAAAVPRSDAPVPASDVVMLDRHHGVLLGARVADYADTVIQRTSDGGAHWTTTFSSRRASLHWIGRDGHNIVVAGYEQLLRSSDGGRTWRSIRPHIATRDHSLLDELSFSGHGVGLSLAPAADAIGFEPAAGLLRTTDAGRRWRPVALPGAGTAQNGVSWLPGGRTVFVAGFARRRRCESAIWRSDDAGAHWRLLRGSCGLALTTLSFRDARHGIAAAGDWHPRYGDADVEAVRATSDGGAHWRLLWRQASDALAETSGFAFVDLTFTDRRHGWMLPGGIRDGANTPYSGNALVTSDGGRRWRGTGQPATALATIGRATAFVVDGDTKAASLGSLARTQDDGAHWTQLADPDQGTAEGLLSAGGWLTDVTSLGTFVSADGGRSWRAAGALGVPAGDVVVARPGFSASLSNGTSRCGRLTLSRDDGHDVRTVRAPGCAPDLERVAFRDTTHGLALDTMPCPGATADRTYSSDDGGRTWQGRPTPVGDLGDLLAFAADGELAVSVGYCDLAERSTVIAISRDAGRTWTTSELPDGEDCEHAAAAGAGQVWLSCGERVLLSTDAGRTWRTHVLPEARVNPDDDEAAIVATGPDSAVRTGPSMSLLQTTDGGAHWTQRWPALPIGPNFHGGAP